jgi:C1A family cysteine protease
MIDPKDVMGIKLALAQPNAVAFSFPVFKSWMNPMSRTRISGQITMRVGDEPVFAGHAVCLVGYQDPVLGSNTSGFFVFRNSWGKNWAKESPYGYGYGTISYEYVRKYGWEALAAR